MCDVTGIFTTATSTRGMWTDARAAGGLWEHQGGVTSSSSSCRYVDVSSPITCTQPPRWARPSLLSPLQSSLCAPLPVCPPLIKTTLVSSTHRRCQPHTPGACSVSVTSTRTQICPVSTLHNLSPLPFCQAHLTSASRPHPLSREVAATSCVYIPHHLLHPPIRSRSREADLGST